MAAISRIEFQAAFQDCVKLLPRDADNALSALFDLTAERLVRLSLTLTGNQPDAEDAVQTAFSRIAGRPRLLHKADAPWPYLIRIVRNESLRLIQKRRRCSSDSPERAESASPTAESMMVYEETTASVRRILRSLPEPQYEVVVLKHWEELTFAEIAEALNLSQNTVASRYRYAIEKLQRSLEPLIR